MTEIPKIRDRDGLHKRRGIWYYCLTINGKRRFFSSKTRNYQEARNARAAAIAAYVENTLPEKTAKWPFEKLLEKVKKDREQHLSENSIRIDRERSGPLIAFFGRRRVEDINYDTIRDFQRARQKVVSAKTINLECGILIAVLKEAKVWKRLKDDYKALRIDRRGPGIALEPEEETLLFDTARTKPGWDAAFLAALVASNTTMRAFELKNLRLENLDLIAAKLIIRKSKTDAGHRIIVLNAPARWACRKLLERANALGSVEPDHFLFPHARYKRTKAAESSAGTGYDPTRPQRSWRSAWRSLRVETAKRAAQMRFQLALEAGVTSKQAEKERQSTLERFAALGSMTSVTPRSQRWPRVRSQTE